MTMNTEVALLVAFVDLSRFMVQSQRISDAALASTLDAYYEEVGAAAQGAGGRLVKCFGDGALVVFPEEGIDRGVAALLRLKDSVDGLMAERGWECRLTVRAHVGPVVEGAFGGAGAKAYDVLGKTVNTAAALKGSGVTLSVAAFRRLAPETRRRFKKHTAAVTYIRAEDQRVKH